MVGGGKDMEEMSKLINIDDERFLDILFDEACVDGKQAERIKAELDKIVASDTEKVVEQLEEERELSYADFDIYVDEVSPCLDAEYDDFFHRGLERVIKIVKGGGVDAGSRIKTLSVLWMGKSEHNRKKDCKRISMGQRGI